MDDVKAAKQQHQRELLEKPNVVGVGVGYKIVGGERTEIPCVIVFVRRKVAAESLAAEQLIPEQVEGVATDVVESGTIYAHQNTEKLRPAPGGVSIGHFRITAGTLGVIARDRNNGERLILSNNHVLANSNDANAGDPIIQPGSADGGTVADDQIGTLVRFQPISFEGTSEPPGCGLAVSYAAFGNFLARTLGADHRVNAYRPQQETTNLVDAAVARPLDDRDVLDEILEVGAISGTVEALPGMPVRKSGRTTALTTGEIIAIDTTVTVNYGAGRNAVFEQQLVAGAMSQPGDSGSLVVEAGSQRAVGLLFAGSDQTTIFSPISFVEDILNITVGD